MNPERGCVPDTVEMPVSDRRYLYNELKKNRDKDMAKQEGITEQLKADDRMEWVRRMNNVRNRARETVYAELIYN